MPCTLSPAQRLVFRGPPSGRLDGSGVLPVFARVCDFVSVFMFAVSQDLGWGQINISLQQGVSVGALGETVDLANLLYRRPG